MFPTEWRAMTAEAVAFLVDYLAQFGYRITILRFPGRVHIVVMGMN